MREGLTAAFRRSAAINVRRHWAAIAFGVAALAVTVHPPYDNTPPIRSDGVGYHAWTRAFVDGDFDFCRMDPVVEEVGAVPVLPSGASTCANKYPMGLALLRLSVMFPFTLANHGHVRSGAEDAVNQACSLAAGVAAVAVSVAALGRLGVSRRLANAVALLTAFGTGLYHYATYDSSFAHVYLAALVAWFCYVGCRWVIQPVREGHAVVFGRRLQWANGVAAFFFVSIRMTSLFPLVVLLAAAMVTTGVHHSREWRAALRIAGAPLAGAAAAVVLQVAYNRAAFHIWTLFSYRGESLGGSGWHQWDVMFSPTKGLFTWYPILALAIVAMIAARARAALALTVAAIVPFVLLYGSWHVWTLAGGFGHRGFVDLVPVFTITFAVALSRLPSPWRRAVTGLAALATLFTMGVMVAYWRGHVSFYGATAGQLWRYGVVRNDLFWSLLHP